MKLWLCQNQGTCLLKYTSRSLYELYTICTGYELYVQ